MKHITLSSIEHKHLCTWNPVFVLDVNSSLLQCGDCLHLCFCRCQLSLFSIVASHASTICGCQYTPATGGSFSTGVADICVSVLHPLFFHCLMWNVLSWFMVYCFISILFGSCLNFLVWPFINFFFLSGDFRTKNLLLCWKMEPFLELIGLKGLIIV